MSTSLQPSFELKPIGTISTQYKAVDECPRSSRYNGAECVLHLDPAYADGLRKIETASHILVLYWLHQADRNTLHRSSPQEDDLRGVFATRSPYRPNPIAVSSVKLIRVDGTQLTVSGLDCLDGTPLLDIKPYVPKADCIPEAVISFDCPTAQPNP